MGHEFEKRLSLGQPSFADFRAILKQIDAGQRDGTAAAPLRGMNPFVDLARDACELARDACERGRVVTQHLNCLWP
jgi:hypothetical protein